METLCIICRFSPSIERRRNWQSVLAESILREFTRQDIVIHRLENQKPSCDDFEFNISHCDGAVAVIISDFPVGVDIERIRTPKYRAAKRLFTANELEVVEEKFWQIWTSKEAIGKARGTGLGSYLADIDTLSPEFSDTLHTEVFGDFICTVCSKIAPKFTEVDVGLFIKN